MPLENLFQDNAGGSEAEDRRRRLCEKWGVLGNPFPSAAQTSGHPHMPTDADERIDAAVKAFYLDRKSHAIAVTASQGIGKTNILNAYEKALRDQLGPRGFFVIRYVADPEPSFDPLIRSIFEHLGEDHLRRMTEALSAHPEDEIARLFGELRTAEVRTLLLSLLNAKRISESKLTELLPLAHEWLLGLPVRKRHREELGVQFRLDTVEAKTRSLRDIVTCSASLELLQGIFLLLDELEKQDFSLSKSVVLRYLSALRALIDALPSYFFLMVALTTDALDRYREMLPALKGRLANQVDLFPIRNVDEAVRIWEFYLDHARMEARSIASEKRWKCGKNVIFSESVAISLFEKIMMRSKIEGVRQREYLNELHESAEKVLIGK